MMAPAALFWAASKVCLLLMPKPIIRGLRRCLFLFIERFLCTRDGSRRNHIDETIGVVIDKADALLGCFWGYQHDDTQVVFVGNGFDNVLVILEGQVGDDGSTDTKKPRCRSA